MRKFILKTILFSLPLLTPVVLFVIIDPFMIFGENRGKMKLTDTYSISHNRDFQTTELFLKNYESQGYDGFILGNSRSFFFDIDDWNKHTKGHGFHFNSSAESLYGIERKLDFLNTSRIPVKNILIVLDHTILAKTTNSKGHLYIKHPILSDESYFAFYKEMFGGFFPKPFLAHTSLFLTGERKPYMEQYGIRENIWELELKTNQLSHAHADSIIANNDEEYYQYQKAMFYERDSVQAFAPKRIDSSQRELLSNINTIIAQNNINVKVIISPLYDQLKLDEADLKYLEDVFGKSNVFDFSGQNKFTNDYKNYYEISHYRPVVAKEMMDIIYGEHTP